MTKFRVLIVEDDPKVASVNRRFVEKLTQFEVAGVVSSGEEAIEAVQTLQPDLLLLDIYLPGTDGVKVLKELRRLDLPIDVILITAAREAGVINEVLRFGATDYIIKPFSFSRFAAALERYSKLKSHLRGEWYLEQGKLDSILNKNSDAELPKGLDPYTMEKVIEFLGQANSANSSEKVADSLGISRITARRYLEYLAQQNQVKVELVYGNVGRPVHNYKLF